MDRERQIRQREDSAALNAAHGISVAVVQIHTAHYEVFGHRVDHHPDARGKKVFFEMIADMFEINVHIFSPLTDSVFSPIPLRNPERN
jgi:hypothetical protein